MSSDPLENNETVEEGAPMWVVTFGDLMSLLLCFFVLLLSFSETDKAVYKQVAGSLEKAFGVQRKAKTMDVPRGIRMIAKDFDQAIIPIFKREEFIASQIKEAIGEEIKKGGVISNKDLQGLIQVKAGEKKVTIRMMGESTFDSGKADIRKTLVPILYKIVTVLKKTKGEIIIAGHTDNVPLTGGVYKSNLGLSMARAASVAEFFLKKGRIRPKRISTMGFGEYRPIATNMTAKGREKNRRVEIVLSTAPFPGIGDKCRTGKVKL